jgi:hypothetical protein
MFVTFYQYFLIDHVFVHIFSQFFGQNWTYKYWDKCGKTDFYSHL